MKKTLLATFLMLVFSACLWAQQKTISGKVTSSDDGQPIPGATVLIKGSNIAAQTDINGDYTISANKGQVLVVNFLGMKSKELAIGDLTILNISLKGDVTGLDEVIVTGSSQGTTRKQLGSYVSTVKGDALTRGASGNVLAGLQGKTAGAQVSQNSGDPAGGFSVRLRGISSVGSSSDPLYIVDGIIVNNSSSKVTNTQYPGEASAGKIGQNRLVDINPADIERMEILNGAAAAAIYGSRANAGVVQIFTKRGSTGAPEISFTSNLIIGNVRKKLEMNQSPVKFGGPTDGLGALTQDVMPLGNPLVFMNNTTPVSRYDYQDYIFQSSTGFDNSISLQGGKENTRYYTSASYFKNEGIIKNTDFKKFSFRANLDQKISKWAAFSAGINYINSAANEKPDGNSFYSPINSTVIIGNFHDIFTRDEFGNLKAIGERGRANPVTVIEDIKQRQETNRVLANSTLKLFPIKNLTVDLTVGVDNSTQYGTTYIPPYAYFAGTGNFGGGGTFASPTIDATQNGFASSANNNAMLLNNDINATYEAKITDKISSTSQIGYTYQYEKGRYILNNGRGLAPFVETVNAAVTPMANNDYRSEYSVSGAFFQQNFKYKDHFFVTGAIRVDESSVFGEDQRNQTYLKGSGSYVLSSADYWKNSEALSFVDLFKLRMAYGESGNLTGIGAYDRFNSYSIRPLVTKTTFNSSPILANEQVKPERQRELELGTDMSFFNSRFGLQFNWYKKQVSDLLLERVIAPTTGFSTLLDNVGSMDNTGIELVVNGSPVRTKNFSWNTSLVYNQNKNTAGNVGGLKLLTTNSGTPVALIDNQPIGVFFGTFLARDGNGNLLLTPGGLPQQERGIQNGANYTIQRDAAGQPLSTAPVLRKIIGDPNPDYTLAFVNDFSYKKLALHIQVDAVQGGDVFNADFKTRQVAGSGKFTEQEQMGLLPRGYINAMNPVEEWRVEDGSFVKLREVSLSYNVGKFKALKNITINLSGRNLYSIDNYRGYDPETNAGGQSTILRGIDFGNVPIPRTFGVGIQAKF